MALHGKTPQKICDAVRDLKTFTIGNVAGRHVVLGFGRLPQEYVNQLREQVHAGKVQYVLYSYGTPMAWLVEGDGWVQPPVKYSSSTSDHQSKFARAIAERVSA